MTAHDLATGTSWAVIDRPYNSDASRFQLPVGLIMISPTRLFCRVRSGHLKLANGCLFAPQAERFLCRPVGEAKQYGFDVRFVRNRIPRRNHKGVTLFPVEGQVADSRAAAAFD